MLVRNKKHFNVGVVMAVSFFALFAVIMMPIFQGMNGLEFADDIFNKLSKGSAYFVPKVAKNVEEAVGKPFSTTIKIDKAEDAERIAKLLNAAGAKAEVAGNSVKVEGDAGKMLAAPVRDADAMYHNDGKKVSEAYGYNEKQVLKDWWQALNRMSKSLQVSGDFQNSKIMSEVNKKLVETSYNYYGIEPQKVTEKAVIMTGLLVFYVVYTLWWGFALYHLFEGLGLTTKKAKIKKEV